MANSAAECPVAADVRLDKAARFTPATSPRDEPFDRSGTSGTIFNRRLDACLVQPARTCLGSGAALGGQTTTRLLCGLKAGATEAREPTAPVLLELTDVRR